MDPLADGSLFCCGGEGVPEIYNEAPHAFIMSEGGAFGCCGGGKDLKGFLLKSL
jgi:hypothetical protein